jgi:hypothetical protein
MQAAKRLCIHISNKLASWCAATYPLIALTIDLQKDPPLNIPSVQNVPSSADWTRFRPLIKELYHDRHCSMAQVRDHLRSLGYWVNTRMIRSRISQWNLQRNNQLQAMAVALRLLDPNPALWPMQDPVFVIRGRQVTTSEILQYFRRKGIRNPLHWCHFITIDQDEPAVCLVTDRVQPSGDVSSGDLTFAECSSTIKPESPVTTRSINRPMPPVSIPIPVFTLEQKAVASMREYCASYLGLGLMTIHQEPEVHQFTVHGRFGDRMSEGLAQMMRGDSSAFPNFHRAFDLVRPILTDCHPMSLSQLLATACELSASMAQSVLLCLLRYVAAMASSLRTSPALVQFLVSLSESAPALLLPTMISSLRVAQAIFADKSPTTWHGLYIQERLCDCLYHERDRTGSSARRVQLLKEQEKFYNPVTRSVLWTITNVADDHLERGDLDGAQTYYMMALKRAESLNGFGRAKLRYATLEGFGRVERIRFETMRNSADSDMESNLIVQCLQNACKYIEEAVTEASIWFEPTSTRVSRVTKQKQELNSLLQAFM